MPASCLLTRACRERAAQPDAHLCGLSAIEQLEARASEVEATDPRSAAALRADAAWMRWVRRAVLRHDPDAVHYLDARPADAGSDALLTIGEPEDATTPATRLRYVRGYTFPHDLVVGEERPAPARPLGRW